MELVVRSEAEAAHLLVCSLGIGSLRVRKEVHREHRTR
jgi:hypothetical protein